MQLSLQLLWASVKLSSLLFLEITFEFVVGPEKHTEKGEIILQTLSVFLSINQIKLRNSNMSTRSESYYPGGKAP